ncbi:hypothetical protein ACN47E_005050 [Coniothyrium glycines]
MTSFHGFAASLVIAAHTSAPVPRRAPYTLPAAQDASRALDAIHALFAAPDAHDGGEERAKKRRKLDDGNALSLHSSYAEEGKSIVLAKISLDIALPTSETDELENTKALQSLPTESTISLETFDRIQPNGFRAIVYNVKTSTGLEIVATAPHDLLDSITPHARTAASLATTTKGKPSRPVFRAALCNCTLSPVDPLHRTYRLDIEIRWKVGLSVVEHPQVRAHYMKEDLRLLGRYFRDVSLENETQWALSDFYDAVHVPSPDVEVSPRISKSLVDTKMYGFQERTVQWLLRREGVAFSEAGELKSFVDLSPPASFRQTQDALAEPCYVSQLRGMVVTKTDDAANDTMQSLRGGILAEEMGLGKTVELIALMSLNKREATIGDVIDPYTGAKVKPSGATLIITPPSILQQWISELHQHAPELKVFNYKGLPPPSAPKKEHEIGTTKHLMRYDVVLTTYQVLSKEIHHATPPPDRSFRHGKRHERRNSPLVSISWWRVCLDEAQMVESGVSQAATVARIIPRCNAWAVTGTPLRKDVQDLRGLLIFLRCDAFANSKIVWDRLDKASFRAIFGQLALRHTKTKIRKELEIPAQKRVVITVPFTAIEEQHYTELMRQMCDACWLTPEGIPTEESRDVDDPEVVERMREWLVRLRQTCLHANVGRKNRKALGAKNGALRTVHEVLEVMIDQNETNWKFEAREMILAQIKQGHVKAYAGDVEDRAQTALPYYEQALKDAQSYVAMCREELLVETGKLGTASADLDEISAAEDDDVKNESLGRIPVLRKSLRSFLELEHACDFFIATTYHQIKENEQFTKPESEEFKRLDELEAEWYEKAKVIRREVLTEVKNRASQQMSIVARRCYKPLPKIEDLPELGGIEARKIITMMDNISDFLNAQAAQIQTWRVKIVDILSMRLVDDDDGKQELTGDEYDDSLKAQDELYVYIMALRTLVADRNAAVNGIQDNLVEHELTAAEKQAKRVKPDEGDRGHAPELLLEIVETRRKLQATLEGGSLKGVVSGIRSLITGLQWRARGEDNRALAEATILQKYLDQAQTIATEQAKIIVDLEKEQETFRGTMNQRLEYYRQFQHISDTVAKWKEELDKTLDEREFDKLTRLRADKARKVAGLRTKSVYLTNLRVQNQTEVKPECIICQDLIEIGVLTTCGHKYCKGCINQWWQQHRTCPLCKQKLGSSDFKDISFKPAELKAQEETQQPASPAHASTPELSSTTSIYSDISDSMMKQIKMIDLDGSYGSKIDMIARHLLWIRGNDGGAKSIIFSQFGDFLEVLREALKKWKIGVSNITDKDGVAKFKSDPAVECFLLDAKSDSSGLTLVNAKYVFLCEPLINPAIELQAIARVHRIGQQQATTAFMYLIQDTVEEAIYDISVARRLEHMSSDRSKSSSRSRTATPALQETTLDAANSAELEAAPLKQLLRKKGDGEIVQQDDLWRCLFGKPRRVVQPVLESEVGRHLQAEAAEGRQSTEAVEQAVAEGLAPAPMQDGRF